MIVHPPNHDRPPYPRDLVLARAIRAAITAAVRQGEYRHEQFLGIGVRAVRALEPDRAPPDALADVRRLWSRTGESD